MLIKFLLKEGNTFKIKKRKKIGALNCGFKEDYLFNTKIYEQYTKDSFVQTKKGVKAKNIFVTQHLRIYS